MTRQGQGTWRLRVSARFDPETGERVRVSRTFRGTKREAGIELADLVSKVRDRKERGGARITVAAYLLDRWLPHMQPPRIRPRTWRRYGEHVRLHIVPRIGSVKLAELDPLHVQGVVDDMTASGLAPSTILQTYRVLSSALKQAKRWRLTATNPAEDASPPQAGDPELVVPGREGLWRLLDLASETDDATPVLLDIATGMRRSELLGLRWTGVDLGRGRVRVTHGLQRLPTPDGSTALELVEVKSKRSRREIALPAFAVESLRRHREEQNERRRAFGEAWCDRGLVFDRGDGQGLDPDAFGKRVKRLLGRAGLDGARLHDLRHAWATMQLEEGTHPGIVSAQLGHANPGFTLSRYSHVIDEMGDVAATATQAALSGPRLARTGEAGG